MSSNLNLSLCLALLRDDRQPEVCLHRATDHKTFNVYLQDKYMRVHQILAEGLPFEEACDQQEYAKGLLDDVLLGLCISEVNRES